MPLGINRCHQPNKYVSHAAPNANRKRDTETERDISISRTEAARTAARVREEEVVHEPREEDRGDVRERGDGGVVPAARLPSEKRQRSEAAAEVTRGVGCDADRCEAPDNDATEAQTGSAFGVQRSACAARA